MGRRSSGDGSEEDREVQAERFGFDAGAVVEALLVDDSVERTKISGAEGDGVEVEIGAESEAKGSAQSGFAEDGILKVIGTGAKGEVRTKDPQAGLDLQISGGAEKSEIDAGLTGIEGVAAAVKAEFNTEKGAENANAEIEFGAGKGGVGEVGGGKAAEAKAKGEVGLIAAGRRRWRGSRLAVMRLLPGVGPVGVVGARVITMMGGMGRVVMVMHGGGGVDPGGSAMGEGVRRGAMSMMVGGRGSILLDRPGPSRGSRGSGALRGSSIGASIAAALRRLTPRTLPVLTSMSAFSSLSRLPQNGAGSGIGAVEGQKLDHRCSEKEGGGKDQAGNEMFFH